jgi:Prophage antirepressor
MNELKVFNNADFGEIRIMEINGSPYWVGKDIADALGYANPRKALADHCKGVTKRYILTEGGKQQMNIIPEGDVYRLITHSQLPAAEQFEKWVFDEVLPSIRKNGEYVTPQKAQQRLGETNAAARIIRQTLKEAGMAPQFVAVAIQSLYAPTGVHIPLEGITVRNRLFDATAIAKHFGIMSRNGNPHIQAVSAIISDIGCDESERSIVPFQKQSNGHSGTTYQYTESVLNRVGLWLERNDYPDSIFAAGKSFKVNYRKMAS